MIRRYDCARPVLAWLALAATLAANVPHFDCVCPNGNRKPFCLSFLWTADCCCPTGHAGASPTVAVGPTASAAVSADPATSCCRCRSQAVSRPSPDDRPVARAEAPCCQKTFVPGAGEAANPAAGSGDAGLLAGAGVVAPTPLPVWLPLPAAAPRIAAADAPLPPPDLVITLRHLVI